MKFVVVLFLCVDGSVFVGSSNITVAYDDEISEIGGDFRRARIGGNERVVRRVVREEIMGVLKKMKGGKAAGMDDYVVM